VITLSFEKKIRQVTSLLTNIGLNEYQAQVLAHLLLVGETKVPTLSKISGVPSARIYGVLDELAKMGLVTIRPGRPILYKSRTPHEIADILLSFNINRFKERLKILEKYAQDFEKVSEKIYLKGKRGVRSVPILRIVSVGEPSLKETRRIYSTAKKEVLILSRAMEYLPEVKESLKKAASRVNSLKIILLKPSLLKPENRKKQLKVIEGIREDLGDKAKIRFVEEVPIRGCIVDPEGDGKALFLVEDPGVPFSLREAAITSHPSVVRGLALMFKLMWEYRTENLDLDKVLEAS
jgi:sugar-specific transcriptional regulator TrmB